MNNPFYVHPGNDFGQGLAGLGQSIQRVGENKRQRDEEQRLKKRFEDAKAAMTSAMQSGDPNQIMQASIDYPELQKTGEMLFGFKSEQTKDIVRDTYRRVLSDPQNGADHIQKGIQAVSEAGGTPSNMMSDLGMFMKNPEAALKSIKSGFALIDPNGYKSMFGEQAGGGIGKYNPRDYTTDSWTQFITSGNPEVLQRYETSMQERIAGDPGLASRVAETQGQVSGAKAGAAEQRKADVREQMEPRIQEKITEAIEKAKRESSAVQAFDKKIKEAGDVNRIIDLAEPLLEEATESWGGAALDAAGRLVGVSTKGAQAAAKLKILQASLMLNMPRMEGPQSDRDVQLYRDAAAQLGDPTIPAETRRAALETIRDLNSKYTDGSRSDQQGSSDIDDLVNKYAD